MALVTIFAVAVMLASGTRWWNGKGSKTPLPQTSSSELLLTTAPVSVQPLKRQKIDIVHTYSGIIRPKDRYSLGFELSGRVALVGKKKDAAADGNQKWLDVGDWVEEGEVLAELDRRILSARKREVESRLRLAKDQLRRKQELRSRSLGSVSEAELQQLESEVSVSMAQLDVAEQQLSDAVLVSPIRGVISRREVEPGESVNANQMLFEVVTVDKVLLVVGVPQSRMHEIQRRDLAIKDNQQESARAQALSGAPWDEEDLVFRAHVRQLGEDRFGRPLPTFEGRVVEIAATADQRTGLFEVEIELDNAPHYSLRPGYIALADVVIDRIEGYRVPISSVVFRDRQAFLYSAEPEETAANIMFTDVGRGTKFTARRHQLVKYIEQGQQLVIPFSDELAAQPALPDKDPLAIVRGQHRLVDGRPLEIVSRVKGAEEPGGESASPSVRLGARP